MHVNVIIQSNSEYKYYKQYTSKLILNQYINTEVWSKLLNYIESISKSYHPSLIKCKDPLNKKNIYSHNLYMSFLFSFFLSFSWAYPKWIMPKSSDYKCWWTNEKLLKEITKIGEDKNRRVFSFSKIAICFMHELNSFLPKENCLAFLHFHKSLIHLVFDIFFLIFEFNLDSRMHCKMYFLFLWWCSQKDFLNYEIITIEIFFKGIFSQT